MKFTIGFIFIFISLNWAALATSDATSWAEIQKTKKGTVTIYWLPNNPFGYVENRQMKGIEIEVMLGFQEFIKRKYQIELDIKWKKEEKFSVLIDKIKNETAAGIFGIAGFSITEERKQFMQFSPSIMSDITVLVSTDDIEIIKDKSELARNLQNATALTAQDSIMEKDLLKLKTENNLGFDFAYVQNSFEFLSEIKKRRKTFGYLSLPVYLMDLNKGMTTLRRHNYFTKINVGRGIAMPKSSDWTAPMNEYFESSDYKSNIEYIIGKYINIDLYHFIKTFSPDNEIGLLNKEKDLQQLKIRLKELEIKEKNLVEKFFIIVIVIVSLLMLVIGILFRKQLRTHKKVLEQKAEIEAQSDEILSINENLEMLVKQRTTELEEQNKKLESFAFFTAHELRGPLARILGLVSIINKEKLTDDNKLLIDHLDIASKELDEVVHSVSGDVSNRVTSKI